MAKTAKKSARLDARKALASKLGCSHVGLSLKDLTNVAEGRATGVASTSPAPTLKGAPGWVRDEIAKMNDLYLRAYKYERKGALQLRVVS